MPERDENDRNDNDRNDKDRISIDTDREQRRELDRRSRDCEQRLLELLCVLHEMGVVLDDAPQPAAKGGSVGRTGSEPANT